MLAGSLLDALGSVQGICTEMGHWHWPIPLALRLALFGSVYPEDCSAQVYDPGPAGRNELHHNAAPDRRANCGDV